MTWLARLKKTEVAGLSGHQASHAGAQENLGKPAMPVAANEPAPVMGLVAVDKVAAPVIPQPASADPPTDPNAWRALATAYHHHHFKCAVCIAASRGAQYGLRCGAGAALWTSYQNT